MNVRWLAALVMMLAAGCTGSPDQSELTSSDEGIRIGSFDFAESVLIAELYAQSLEHHGFDVDRLGQLGPREVVAPAIEQDLVDVVPEYLGAVEEYFTAPTPNHDSGLELDRRGLLLLQPAPAQDVNVFVMTSSAAERLGVEKISDLVPHASGLRIGGPVECPDRPLCAAGLRDVYGIEFSEFVPQQSLPATTVALEFGEIDVGVMFSTSAELADSPLVVLQDDGGLQPAENVVPLVRREAVNRWGTNFTLALDGVSAQLTTADLQELNRRVGNGESVRRVAASWLSSKGLVTS